MLEDILIKRPNTARRLRSGLAGFCVDEYVKWLSVRRYKASTQSLYLHSLARYCAWMAERHLVIGEDAVHVLAAYRQNLEERGVLRRKGGSRPGHIRGDVTVAGVFNVFLVESGLARPAAKPATIEDRRPVLREYASWMTRHRGLLRSSVQVYLTVLERLVIALGEQSASYTAQRLRAFVASESAKFGLQRATTITIATRSFVRFLVATGRATAGMEDAIPYPAFWDLGSLPRYIDSNAVENVLAACPSTPAGVRDRAILLLLARLGLRASEVSGLLFADIDWSAATLGIAGKGRRRHWLPLSQEVGDAILAYVGDVRPRIPDEHIFLRVVAPYRHMGMEAVAGVAKRALDRAEVVTASRGSHVFRHALATTMLRRGVSMEGIGAVLRHRRVETTAHYAKVDLGMLSEIARPWPGVPR